MLPRAKVCRHCTELYPFSRLFVLDLFNVLVILPWNNYAQVETRLCPVRIGTPHQLNPRRVFPPLIPGGHTRLRKSRWGGGGGPNSDDWTDTVVLKVYMNFAGGRRNKSPTSPPPYFPADP